MRKRGGGTTSIHKMEDRQHRMPLQHAGAREAHHLAHLLARLGPVAVDRAVGAGGFFGPVGTAVEPLIGVIEELVALRAQSVRAVVVAAVELDHGAHRSPFALQSPGFPLRAHSTRKPGVAPGVFRKPKVRGRKRKGLPPADARGPPRSAALHEDASRPLPKALPAGARNSVRAVESREVVGSRPSPNVVPAVTLALRAR
jgi:hypothetical protein